MTDREVMKQALEALERARPQIRGVLPSQDADAAITALRARLAEPEPEPVAHKHEWFRTGAMEPGQMRCISCGVWGCEVAPPARMYDELVDAAKDLLDVVTDVDAASYLRMQRLLSALVAEPQTCKAELQVDGAEAVVRVMVSGNVPGRIDELDVLKALPCGIHFLYTAPPARRSLTDEEISAAWAEVMLFPQRNKTHMDLARSFARAIERAHKIGGNDE